MIRGSESVCSPSDPGFTYRRFPSRISWISPFRSRRTVHTIPSEWTLISSFVSSTRRPRFGSGPASTAGPYSTWYAFSSSGPSDTLKSSATAVFIPTPASERNCASTGLPPSSSRNRSSAFTSRGKRSSTCTG